MIRSASPADKNGVIGLLRNAYEFGNLPDVLGRSFSPAHASILFDEHCATESRCCIVLDQGRLNGVLMAVSHPHPFADIMVASEVAWWIEPDARGGESAKEMLSEYEQWAAARGCALVDIVSLESFPRAAILYRRNGYRVAETHHFKALGA